MSDAIGILAQRLIASRTTTVLTGAGVSAASGVPTFRGSGGLWKQFRAEDLATPEAFDRDPALVWEWYDWRRQLIAACAPNAAHRVLAGWSATLPAFTVITQNVDGLHERAGTRDLVRLHGSIWELRCRSACPAGTTREDRRVPLPDLPPRCACGALLRPGVVWFGEALEAAVVARAQAATSCDVFITAGTSAVVYPAAGLIASARAQGAFTVEINPDETDVSARVDLSIRGTAETVLAALEPKLRTAS